MVVIGCSEIPGPAFVLTYLPAQKNFLQFFVNVFFSFFTKETYLQHKKVIFFYI